MKSYSSPEYNQVFRALAELLGIMTELREKCPWDQQQTLKSLRHLTIEETFELSEAILEDNVENIKKELGDLLFHIIFYAAIAAEQQAFTITDIIQTLCKKLINRHPHIYGKETVENMQESTQNWEKRKLQEEGNRSVLGGVPHTLPSLIKALRIQEKVSRIGFDWLDSKTAWKEAQEKMKALTQQSNQRRPMPIQQEKVQEELGALLFVLVNCARLVKINPEEALEKANRKFIRKFQRMEQLVSKQNLQITQLSTEALMRYWEEVS